MYEFDSGTLQNTFDRGQVHLHGNKAHETYRESIAAVKKLGSRSTGYHSYVFDESDVVECVEKLDSAGHRVTMSCYTVQLYGDVWDIVDDPKRYPDNWDEIRSRVYERDEYTCQRCGDRETELHAHHRKPISKGGTHHIDNLKTVCHECHEEIHNFSFEEN